MKHDAYYIISPNENLKTYLTSLQDSNKLNEEDCAFLLEKRLWKMAQGGRSAWMPSDQHVRLKLVFVERMKYWFSKHDFAEEIFKDMRTSLKTFDLWWNFEYFMEPDETFEIIVEELPVTEDQIEYTGNPLVDKWIKEKWLEVKKTNTRPGHMN